MSTREAVSSQSALLNELRGAECSQVRFSIGRELVVGFGPLRRATKPLTGDLAEWLLFTGSSLWSLRSSAGLIASSQQRGSEERVLARLRESLDGHRVAKASVLDSANSLEIVFEDGSELRLLASRKPAKNEATLWELRTPHDYIIAATRSRGLEKILKTHVPQPSRT